MSFFSKFSIFSKCSICGREISPFEKRFYFKVPEAPKNNRLWVCKDCIKIKGKAIFLPDGSMKIQQPDGTLMDTATSNVNKEDVESTKKTITTIAIIALIGFVICAIIMGISSGISNSKNNHKDYKDGDYYENYDYDDDGKINQKEWEDALGDYMDNIMD